jgi:hypothetical protein
VNIFLCCFQADQDYPISPYKFWLENLRPTLQAMGHTVIEPAGVDLVVPFVHLDDKGWIERQRAITSDQLIQQVTRAHAQHGIDVFLSYFYTVQVQPEFITQVGRLGIPTVNFFCDNLREFHRVSELVDAFTLNWVPEKHAGALYRARRAPYVYLPMAADPNFYRTEPGEELNQVTFVGGVDGLRTRLIAEVLPTGLPLRVFGRRWKPEENGSSSTAGHKPQRFNIRRRLRKSVSQHWDRLRYYGVRAELRHFMRRGLGLSLLRGFESALMGSVSQQELLHLGRNSAVFLGINRCPHPGYPLNAPLVYSRLRDIEGPMMGACYLTEYCEDLDDLYEVGREIAVYRNAEELVGEARRLLEDGAARARMRRLGHAAALARHTWERRFEVLFRTLGLRSRASAG